MILISLVVLSIIGTAVIAYTTSNYKLRKTIGHVEENQYIAEGGVDQVYGVLAKIISESNGDKDTIVQEIKSRINSESNSDDESGDYDDLKDGNLKIRLDEVASDLNFDDDEITIRVEAQFERKTVSGLYIVDSDFNIILDSKDF